MELSGGQTTGSYVNMNNSGNTTTTWNNISFGELLPYQEELPNNCGSDSGANMSGNVLLLHLNEASGTIIDSSGNGYTGTTYGGVTYNVGGKFNTALEFDGIDDYVEFSGTATGGVNSLELNDSFSISFWFYPTQSQSAYLINNYQGTGTYNGNSILIHIDPMGGGIEFGLHIDDNVNPTTLNLPTALPINQWYHAVCVRDKNNTVYIYINAEEKISGSDTTTGSVLSDRNWVIGRRSQSAGEQFTGLIDEVAFWNKTLSVNEILNIYKRGALNLTMRYRACDDAICAGDPWESTILTNSTTKVLSGVVGQYFQMDALFDTENGTYSPVLDEVLVGYTIS